MSTPAFDADSLHAQVGEELGVSEWMTVDQQRIDYFALCTGDHQWIHVDTERARRESAFGTTIAHGYLTLSTIAAAAFEVFLRPRGVTQAVNYGLDRVRFITPVIAGSRVRTRIKLLGLEKRDDKLMLVTTENTVEIEGSKKPALVAQALVLLAA